MAQSFLQGLMVNSFMNVIVNDVGSQANTDISFWYPAYTQQGYYYVGMYATDSYTAPPAGGMYVYQAVNDDPDNPCFAAPTGFSQMWECTGNGSPSFLGIYNPIAPNGYIAIGTVAVSDFRNPPTVAQFPNLMCVRQDLATQITVNIQSNLIWADHGDGTNDSVTVYQLPNSLACYAVQNYPNSSPAFDIVL